MINCYRAPSSTWKQDRFLSRNSSREKAYVYFFHLAVSHLPEPQQVKPLQQTPWNNGFKSSCTSQGEQDYTSWRNPLEAITEDFLRGSF